MSEQLSSSAPPEMITMPPSVQAALEERSTPVYPPVEMVTPLPASEKPEEPLSAPRYVIDRVPTQEELSAGSAYEGEEGEYADVAKLMGLLAEYDADRKLASPEYRTAVIERANLDDAKQFIFKINEALYPDSGGATNVAEGRTILKSGEGDTYKAGTIGVDPRDFDEVLGTILDGVKKFAGEGKMLEAGLLAANAFVPMQMMKDGNKRTARAMFELIGYGYDDKSFYDHEAMRRRLGFTKEARQSLYYSGMSSSLSTPYVQEKLPAEQRDAFKQVGYYWSQAVERPHVLDALSKSKIADTALQTDIANIIQQDTFGTQYVFESTRPELIQAFYETRDASHLKQAVAEFATGLTDETARTLVARDRQERKEYTKRLVRSTTGERPLVQNYDRDGNPVGTARVTLLPVA